jgi:uncharacterized protein
MKHREFKPRHLDIAAFAESGVTLEADTPLPELERLAASAHPEHPHHADTTAVRWQARAEARPQRSGAPQVWLHLQADASVALECQRCLQPVTQDFDVDRWFRFADTEAEAAALDAESEDDVLVTSRNFDLLALIEDELLLDLPVIPRHEVCPPSVVDAHTVAPGEHAEPDEQAADDAPAAPSGKPNPFAVLAGLRKPGGASEPDA